CPKCGYHFRLTASQRISLTFDDDSFVEYDDKIFTGDPLKFPGYSEKMKKCKVKTGMEEAVVTGEGTIEGMQVIACIMDFNFMGGSLGSVVGEKITSAIEKATETGRPIIIFSTAGGARMQEGMLSLMQMAKTSAAIARLNEARVPYISVLTDPTMGGVSASLATLGDVNIAEPGALIGFAGPRVIEQTVRETLPEGFQRAEFLLEHGAIDRIVDRRQMREEIAALIGKLGGSAAAPLPTPAAAAERETTVTTSFLEEAEAQQQEEAHEEREAEEGLGAESSSNREGETARREEDDAARRE
ncbi:MAG: acetyl-CoA carboxylase, carboxyltransferase subunit beta, partial [Halorhodospira sp.]